MLPIFLQGEHACLAIGLACMQYSVPLIMPPAHENGCVSCVCTYKLYMLIYQISAGYASSLIEGGGQEMVFALV